MSDQFISGVTAGKKSSDDICLFCNGVADRNAKDKRHDRDDNIKKNDHHGAVAAHILSRKGDGLILSNPIRTNTSLANMAGVSNGIVIDKDKEYAVAVEYKEKLKTKCPTVEQNVGNLSGGNQQKVVIAKWLTRDSDILIFDEPTRGIDVGAKNEIYKLMSKLAAEGKSIIMISSEMTEVLRMSDRIIIMCEGKVTGCIDISEATQENIMDKATRNID